MPGLDEPEVDIRAILGLLRRQARLIFLVAALVVALAGLVALSLTPIFSASTLVMVDTSHKDLLDPTAQLPSGSSDSARVDSEVELVLSDATL